MRLSPSTLSPPCLYHPMLSDRLSKFAFERMPLFAQHRALLSPKDCLLLEEIRSTSFQTLRVTKSLPGLSKGVLAIQLLHDNELTAVSGIDVSLEWHQSILLLVTLAPGLIQMVCQSWG